MLTGKAQAAVVRQFKNRPRPKTRPKTRSSRPGPRTAVYSLSTSKDQGKWQHGLYQGLVQLHLNTFTDDWCPGPSTRPEEFKLHSDSAASPILLSMASTFLWFESRDVILDWSSVVQKVISLLQLSCTKIYWVTAFLWRYAELPFWCCWLLSKILNWLHRLCWQGTAYCIHFPPVTLRRSKAESWCNDLPYTNTKDYTA